MIRFLKLIGAIKNEAKVEFKMAPALIMMVLMLAFFATTVYILISSLTN